MVETTGIMGGLFQGGGSMTAIDLSALTLGLAFWPMALQTLPGSLLVAMLGSGVLGG